MGLIKVMDAFNNELPEFESRLADAARALQKFDEGVAVFTKKMNDYKEVDENLVCSQDYRRQNGKIMINGWLDESNYLTEQILVYYNNSKIHGYIFTDVSQAISLKSFIKSHLDG